SLGQCPGNVTSLLIDAARDFSSRRLWAAFGFERARATIKGACAIEDCFTTVDRLARRRKALTRRAGVDIALLVEREVLPTEGAIVAFRLVDHRDVGRYILVFAQPVEVWTRTVGGIGREPLGLDIEALLGALNHGLCRTDFGLAEGARCLPVTTDPAPNVDPIVLGI